MVLFVFANSARIPLARLPYLKARFEIRLVKVFQSLLTYWSAQLNSCSSYRFSQDRREAVCPAHARAKEKR